MNNNTLLYINSKDRSNGTPSQFNYTLPQGVRDCKAYYIKNVVIPYVQYVTIYKSTTGGNQYFTMGENGGPTFQISLSPGNYSASQLATMIQTAINGVFSNVYSVSYNANTYLFTISNTGAPTFFIDWSNNNVFNVYQSIGFGLGYANLNSGFVNSLISVEPAQLAGPNNYFIKSSSLNIGQPNFFQDQQSNAVLQIPINAVSGGYIIYENQDQLFYPLKGNNNLNVIDIGLYDDYNNVVDMNGINWSMTLCISNRNNI